MARQKLGQHFLRNTGILEKIAVAACGQEAGLAVEVGPGQGALTAHLLRHAARVVALEIDQSLISLLREKWSADPRLEIRHEDAVQTDFASFGPGVLAGNLPYYVASAIIARYLRSPGQLRHGVFLIQKEVACRISAKPRTRDYGFLSVECQILADAEYLFTVPSGAFQPPPKVESAVIRLTPKPAPAGTDTTAFLSFVSTCFRQKRKTLRNNLASRYPKEQLGADVFNRRAEELNPDELRDLFYQFQ